MPGQTVSALFRAYYNWGSARTGVALSVNATVGDVLGEVVSGPVIVRAFIFYRLNFISDYRQLQDRVMHDPDNARGESVQKLGEVDYQWVS